MREGGGRLKVGLNPYGVCCAVGLIGKGTPQAAPNPLGLDGFVALGESIGARCIELDHRMLATADSQAQSDLGDRLKSRGIKAIIAAGLPSEGLAEPIEMAIRTGARIIRMGMTTVLCGDRAVTPDWGRRVAASRRGLKEWAPRAADKGIDLVIEDHQDLGSEELLQYADEAGPNVGICFDTGNPLAVGEDILCFAKRVAAKVRHLHLKDYQAQFTDEGYRLVRCPIGDGCVPFQEIETILSQEGRTITASLEPGALHARHVRLFRADWWNGYPAREAKELGQALATARQNHLPENADHRTPLEKGACGQEIADYEMAVLNKSVANANAFGWL